MFLAFCAIIMIQLDVINQYCEMLYGHESHSVVNYGTSC